MTERTGVNASSAVDALLIIYLGYRETVSVNTL